MTNGPRLGGTRTVSKVKGHVSPGARHKELVGARFKRRHKGDLVSFDRQDCPKCLEAGHDWSFCRLTCGRKHGLFHEQDSATKALLHLSVLHQFALFGTHNGCLDTASQQVIDFVI